MAESAASQPTTAAVDPVQDAIANASGDVYVPSTAEVREAYITAPDFMPYSGPAVKGAEFDAWLATIREQARGEHPPEEGKPTQ